MTLADAVNRFQCSSSRKQYSSKKVLVYHAKSHSLDLLQGDKQNYLFPGCFKVFTIPKSSRNMWLIVHTIHTIKGISGVFSMVAADSILV